MTKLVPLDAKLHGDLKLSENRQRECVAGRHMLPLQVTEITQAISSFPVMISRVQDQARWALSALASFEPGKNLFATDKGWDSSFQSAEMQTFPLFLMRAEDGSEDPVLGLYDDADCLKKDTGEPLFTKGKLSLTTKQLEKRLHDNIRTGLLTHRFLDHLQQIDLIRSIDIGLHMASGAINKIRGLHMIHEDNLQKLPAAQFEELRRKGYLAPIHAILFSVFQFNNLIRRHNDNGLEPISRISLEVSKDNA